MVIAKLTALALLVGTRKGAFVLTSLKVDCQFLQRIFSAGDSQVSREGGKAAVDMGEMPFRGSVAGNAIDALYFTVRAELFGALLDSAPERVSGSSFGFVVIRQAQ